MVDSLQSGVDGIETAVKVMLGGSPKRISEKEFMDMLEVLPPKKWESGRHFESFLMIEHYSGPYTSQYVRVGEREGVGSTYFTKIVDSTDRSTWMTPGTFFRGGE